MLQKIIAPKWRPGIGKITVVVAGKIRMRFEHLGDDSGACSGQAGDVDWFVNSYGLKFVGQDAGLEITQMAPERPC